MSGRLFTVWATREAHTKIVQFSSVAQSCAALCDPVNCSTPGLPVHHQLPEFTKTQVHWVGDAIHYLILHCPLLLLPPISPSIRVLSNESTLHMRWPKYWSFSFSIIPSKNTQDWSPLEWTGWISLQCKGLSRVYSNTTVQKHQFFSATFFTVQLSHSYMTTGRTIALTRRTFVGKVMCPLLNMLSRVVITFLPRSKCLLISWLQSPSAVISEPPRK